MDRNSRVDSVDKHLLGVASLVVNIACELKRSEDEVVILRVVEPS